MDIIIIDDNEKEETLNNKKKRKTIEISDYHTQFSTLKRNVKAYIDVLKNLFSSNTDKQKFIDIFLSFCFACVIGVSIGELIVSINTTPVPIINNSTSMECTDSNSDQYFIIAQMIISGLGIVIQGLSYLADYHTRVITIARGIHDCNTILSSLERSEMKKRDDATNMEYLKRMYDKFNNIKTQIHISEQKII